MSVKIMVGTLSELEGKLVTVITSSGQVKTGTLVGIEALGAKDCIKLKLPSSIVNISYMESIDEINQPVVEKKESDSERSNSDLANNSQR